MAVYVDDARIPYGRMRMCHMIADSEAELHQMADCIGLKRQWFQAPPKVRYPHYDVSLSLRDRAIGWGAIPLHTKALVLKAREIESREEKHDD